MEQTDTGRQAVAMSGREDIVMQKLNGGGRVVEEEEEDI